MKPQIIYDGEPLDGDRPSSFSEDCRQLARTTAIASTVAIALPLGIAAAVVIGITEAVHAAKEIEEINALKGKKQ